MIHLLFRISAVFALLTLVHSVTAQQPGGPITIVMKDGQTITTSTLARSGNSVIAMVKVGTGIGQVGYPLASIDRIEFPDSPQLKAAGELLAKGRAGEALGTLSAVLSAQEPFRDVPGNFWAQAAIMKLNALAGAGRESEADALLAQITASSDPAVVRAARAQQAASWTRKGEHEKALSAFDAIIKEESNRETLATAWLNMGHSLLALKKWEPAALAYLHIPVFYSDMQLLVPKALLGAAEAMEGMKEYEEAEARLDSLIAEFPSSPEAREAKAKLEKLKKRTS